MATIEELERQAAAIDEAEGAALGSLVEFLRRVTVELPEGSRLARSFAVSARRLEPWATPRDAMPVGSLTLLTIVNEVLSERREQYGDQGAS